VTVLFVLISLIILVCGLLGSLWWQLYSRLSYSCRRLFTSTIYVCLSVIWWKSDPIPSTQHITVFFFICSVCDCGPGQLSRYSDSLQAGRSGNQILVGAYMICEWERDFPSHQDWHRGSPNLPYNGYWVFPGGKAAGEWCSQPTS
jgi:hypothetical protein